MEKNRYAELPEEPARTEQVQLVDPDPVPMGPEGGGDAD